MNDARRKKLAKAQALVEEAQSLVAECAEEEREAFDNMPESLQQGEKGQELETNADALEDIADKLANDLEWPEN